ncbi:Aste57867_24491 [Aphanomyces stellatus]|uniref:Aste57867_24491 protein n=1 Tax=Aphanomyces stellatus TaxID=120398 RepID=A0A485LSG5_9STRA|nr:hypothetical protein As57867_024414 [Aphanomyces stellatus]VFU01130.1 Aste57867_24491 [Aphanomyces stellatus]
MDLIDVDLTALCDLLDGDGDLSEEIELPHASILGVPSDATVGREERTPPPAGTKPTKRVRSSTKTELGYLKAKHDDLVTQLTALQTATSDSSSMGVWEQRAKSQGQEAQRSLQENARLKEALNEQIGLIDALQRVFRKKPRLSAFPSSDLAEWKAARLGSTGRHEALQLLLDHQYADMDSQWIRHGLHDTSASSETLKKAFIRSSHDIMLVHCVQCSTWSAPFDHVASVLWDMVSVKIKVDFANQYVSEVSFVRSFVRSFVPCVSRVSAQRVEAVDDNTVYTRFCAEFPNKYLPAVDGRLASKRYISARRVVIVYRSILDDVLVPLDPQHLKDNQRGWVAVEPCGNSQTRLTILTCQTPPLAPSLRVEAGAMSEYMLTLFAQNAAAFDASLAMALSQ